ncbi:hypothetical protein [Bacillus pseudomycoides]|uniref:hypothetical protein n=1 Tax=Bacillus pseudomycoides TaxID=64104 RepID=UPI000BF0631E|nr:hypothetical protein [Bacillus pseudomycoides]PEM25428.1 hypothetical protein CN634_30455 [Bacillus pseudomycoides]
MNSIFKGKRMQTNIQKFTFEKGKKSPINLGLFFVLGVTCFLKLMGMYGDPYMDKDGYNERG